MGYAPGVPQSPVLITIDGNAFYVWRSSIETIEGIPYISMRLEPFDWVISRLNIKQEDLDFSESSVGHLIRKFPLTSRVVLSDNPEKPIWLLMTGINGERVNWDQPALAPLVNLKMELDRKDARIAMLEAEVKELREENRRLVRLTREYKEEMKKIFGGMELPTALPQEYLGMKITKEGVKR